MSVAFSKASHKARRRRSTRTTTPHKFYGYGAPPQAQLQSPYYGMEGQDPYWNIATGAPPNMFSMGPNSAGIGSPGYGGHMGLGSRGNQAWQDFYDYSTYRAYMGQEIGVHQPDWEGVDWNANRGGNIYDNKWSFNQLPGQGADWADWRYGTGTVRQAGDTWMDAKGVKQTVGAGANDPYIAAQKAASWQGRWDAAAGLKDAKAMRKAQNPLAMEYLAYNDPMAYSKFTTPSNDLWQFMGMGLYGGL